MPPAIKNIHVEPIQLENLTLRLIGVTPLLMNNAEVPASRIRDEIETGQKPPHRTFKQTYYDSMHVLSGNPQKAPRTTQWGLPAEMFTKSIVSATRYNDTVTKDGVNGSVTVLGPSMVPLFCSLPKHDQRAIRNPTTRKMNVSNRALFEKWGVILNVQYVKNVLTSQQVIALFDLAGFMVGVGSFRAVVEGGSGGGRFGKFRIAQNMAEWYEFLKDAGYTRQGKRRAR